MTGSYLLYNELHYNGLMTDWGLYLDIPSLSILKEEGFLILYQRQVSF